MSISDRNIIGYSFNSVIGQNNTKLLMTNLISAGKFPNASMFLGDSGVGKSFCAEIVGMTLLCENSKKNPCLKCNSCRNILKALNTGKSTDNFMKINAGLFRSRKKADEMIEEIFMLKGGGVYIINEFHTFEEPEQTSMLEEIDKLDSSTYVIITTNRKFKLINSFRNGRLKKFEFKTPTFEECVILANRVVSSLGVNISNDAIRYIIKNRGNNPRDIVSTLELLVDGNFLTDELIFQYLGQVDSEKYIELLKALNMDMRKYYLIVDSLPEKESFVWGLKDFAIDLLCVLYGGSRTSFSIEATSEIKKIFSGFTEMDFLNFLDFVGEMKGGKDSLFSLIMLKRFWDGKTDIRQISVESPKEAGVERATARRDSVVEKENGEDIQELDMGYISESVKSLGVVKFGKKD